MAAIIGDVLATTLDLVGEGDYIGGLLRAAGGHRAFDVAVEGSNRRLALFGGVAAVAAGGITAGIVTAVNAAGRMERIETGFRTVLGSAEAARAKIEELQKFAVVTPFNFEDLARGSQALLGVGTDANQIIPIMRALGNAVAATGGSTDEFNRAVYAVKQIISGGRLMGPELRQLSEAGLPLTEVMAELGVTFANVGERGSARRGSSKSSRR